MMRILITRLSAIGDAILTMPLACALKSQSRDNEVVWLAEKGPAKLLHDHPCVDEVVEVGKGWLKSPATIMNLRRRLRRRFDVAIDPQSLLKSSTAGLIAGAPLRIGFAPPRGRETAPWVNHINVRYKKTHLVDCQLELLHPLGIQPPCAEFQVPRTDECVTKMDHWLGRSPELSGGNFVLLNTGAGWGSKLWPVERYAALAHDLYQKYGLPSVVVWAGEQERQWAESIVVAQPKCCHLAPPTSLLELAELFRHGRFFVGSDTGPLHLAAAVGLPCVGLHGPTDPAKSGAYGSQHQSVQAYLQTGSSRERRGNNNHAMRAIDVQAVSEACGVLMKSSLANIAA